MSDLSIYYSKGNEAEISSAMLLRAICLTKCKALLHKNTQKENIKCSLITTENIFCFANYYPISCVQPASSWVRQRCCCGNDRCHSSAGGLDRDETAGCGRQCRCLMAALQRALEQK
jgi:hypothetical protein